MEDDLVKKEAKLEKKVKSDEETWGEELGGGHSIHMKPLMPHVREVEHDIMDKAKRIGDKIKSTFDRFRKRFDHSHMFGAAP